MLSWLLLGLFVANLLLIPLGVGDIGTLIAVLVIFGALILSAVLNRRGLVTTAAIIPVVVICLAIFFSLLTEANGLDLDAIPAYDLLVISVIIAAAVLEPVAGFIVAVINIALICADYFIQPHAIDLTVDIASYSPPTVGVITLLARPIALEIIIAVIAFLWARGMSRAQVRADTAEEIARLQQQIVEQKEALDVGIKAMLEVHTRAANGDFNARVPDIPQLRQSALWAVAISLNTFMNRVQRSAVAEQEVRFLHQELSRLNEAIRDVLTGRRPVGPTPLNTSSDPDLSSIWASFMALMGGPTSGVNRQAGGALPPAMNPPGWGNRGSYDRPTGPFPPQTPYGPNNPSAYPPPWSWDEDPRNADH